MISNRDILSNVFDSHRKMRNKSRSIWTDSVFQGNVWKLCSHLSHSGGLSHRLPFVLSGSSLSAMVHLCLQFVCLSRFYLSVWAEAPTVLQRLLPGKPERPPHQQRSLAVTRRHQWNLPERRSNVSAEVRRSLKVQSVKFGLIKIPKNNAHKYILIKVAPPFLKKAWLTAS